MTRTSIEWATDSWNPIAAYDRETGKRGWFCTKVSPGCTNCYAEQWNRFRGNGHLYRVANIDKVRFELAPTLKDPLHWRKPRRVFVNSMTDLFLEQHTDEMIDQVFSIMGGAPEHEFLVLTKRPERMRAYMSTCAYSAWNGRRMEPEAFPPRNVWLGVSVENQEQANHRIPLLLETPAVIRFLSCEPLLGPVDLTTFLYDEVEGTTMPDFGSPRPSYRGLSWVIVGFESGPGARPGDLQWIRDIVSQCIANDVHPFVKQLGAVPMMDEADWRQQSEYGAVPILSARNRDRVPVGYVPIKLLDRKGGNPDEWPSDLRVREYPKEAMQC